MIAEELCALFQTLNLQETKEYKKLKDELDSALEDYLLSLPATENEMDISEECVDCSSGLLFLYIECTVMASCLACKYLVSIKRNDNVRLTSLPPYQSDVTFSEVSKELESLRDGSVINYGDPFCNSYFATFVPSDRFKNTDKITCRL
ncbi:Glycoside hydrolase [Parasponia andersonii]|uniref:Glycoside hydrolase n=1 Tax=Parasponia andersonii TaxID=3476 RepID=A0A2P5AVN0_PARAD|nr:Glycoside hydrolase [Parasponia andersonii]